MTDIEKVALENWARQLSDQELRKEYDKAICILADAIEDNHFFGIPFPKALEERVNILGKIVRERRVNL